MMEYRLILPLLLPLLPYRQSTAHYTTRPFQVLWGKEGRKVFPAMCTAVSGHTAAQWSLYKANFARGENTRRLNLRVPGISHFCGFVVVSALPAHWIICFLGFENEDFLSDLRSKCPSGA